MAKLQLTYLFDSEDELRAHLGGEVKSVVTETVDQETGEVKSVDVDGFPYDAELHAETRAVNADGRWKVKRGKAEAEAAARAAFKAAGATVADAAPPVAAMPVAEAAPALPGLPTAAVARAPVSLDDLVKRIQGGMASGKVSLDDLSGFYAKAGNSDPNAYATNETLRAALWSVLDEAGV